MNRTYPFLAAVICLLLVTGCSTTGTTAQQKRTLCTIAGAAVGGAAGKLGTDEKDGVAVGAIAGGVIAWLVCQGESDADGDGVTDNRDRCPGTPRGTAVDSTGCPLDSDGDGVADYQDQCPDTPRGARVDTRGCSLDSDGDGVSDEKDRCPNTPRGAKVDGDGCELDSDGDGVVDSKDECPGTPRGTPVNDKGCRTILSLKGVNFEFNSAALSQDAKTELDRAVKLLQEEPGLSIRVEGHTDAQGPDDYNLMLSQKRAESVVAYLASRGIERNRMTAKGFGESTPVASNETKAGRALNRRVDLVRSK